MVIREQITVRATCEDVWPLVADPCRVAEWNPKLVSVDRAGSGPLRLGERFGELYRMSGRDRQTDCEVIELQHASLIVVRHRPLEWDTVRHVDERYRLQPVRDGMQLVQELDFSQSGIAWPFQFLMWIIHRTGKPTGKRYLVALKEIAEHEPHSTRV